MSVLQQYLDAIEKENAGVEEEIPAYFGDGMMPNPSFKKLGEKEQEWLQEVDEAKIKAEQEVGEVLHFVTEKEGDLVPQGTRVYVRGDWGTVVENERNYGTTKLKIRRDNGGEVDDDLGRGGEVKLGIKGHEKRPPSYTESGPPVQCCCPLHPTLILLSPIAGVHHRRREGNGTRAGAGSERGCTTGAGSAACRVDQTHQSSASCGTIGSPPCTHRDACLCGGEKRLLLGESVRYRHLGERGNNHSMGDDV